MAKKAQRRVRLKVTGKEKIGFVGFKTADRAAFIVAAKRLGYKNLSDMIRTATLKLVKEERIAPMDREGA